MDIEHEVARFFADWSIDFSKKLIYRKKQSLIKRLMEFIIRPKYPVLSLYRFARHHESTSTGIVYPEIVDRDMLPKIEELPTRFVLNEPWKIQAHDLKTLYLGPLTQNTAILVPPFPKNGFFTTAWDVFGVLATLGGAIGFILLIWQGISYALKILA